MARTRPHVELGPVLMELGRARRVGDPDDPILDAAESLLTEFGLRHWSIDDVADRAGVGRTTVYRRFGGRDDLVHRVLARELRRTLTAIETASRDAPDPESQVVEAMVAALGALRTSVVDRLLEVDPDTFLPFLTTRAGPLIALAQQAIARGLIDRDPSIDPELAEHLGELAARIGLSFVLTRPTSLPTGDDDALRVSLRAIVRPVLGTVSVS